MGPVLPCIKALPRSSPETVKTAVAQVKDASAVVVSVIEFLAHFFTDASVDFTWVLLLLFILVAGAREAKRCAIQQCNPPFRSGTYFSPCFGTEKRAITISATKRTH